MLELVKDLLYIYMMIYQHRSNITVTYMFFYVIYDNNIHLMDDSKLPSSLHRRSKSVLELK